MQCPQCERGVKPTRDSKCPECGALVEITDHPEEEGRKVVTLVKTSSQIEAEEKAAKEAAEAKAAKAKSAPAAKAAKATK